MGNLESKQPEEGGREGVKVRREGASCEQAEEGGRKGERVARERGVNPSAPAQLQRRRSELAELEQARGREGMRGWQGWRRRGRELGYKL